MIPEEQPLRAARYSDLFDSGHRHEPSDCSYCPICATISVVRNARPELLTHLGAAAREFLLAAQVVLEEASDLLTPEPSKSDAPPDDATNVRRIDGR